MKSVLISIRPQWVEKITSGEKTIEVRKTAPKEVPFKCYIYETQGRTETPWIDEDGHFIYKGRGQVIGEFICDKITDISVVVKNCNEDYNHVYHNDECKGSCLTWKELQEYSKDKPLYAWHINELKIYDKPRELSEFRTPKNPHRIGNSHSWILDGYKKITRPPQSWCYVEDLGEEE